jgi:hypothetical protein
MKGMLKTSVDSGHNDQDYDLQTNRTAIKKIIIAIIASVINPYLKSKEPTTV